MSMPKKGRWKLTTGGRRRITLQEIIARHFLKYRKKGKKINRNPVHFVPWSEKIW